MPKLLQIRQAFLGSLACAGLMLGCSQTTSERLKLPPLRTVAKVELARYLGTWYEIANYPQRFQKGCTGTQARYALREDGDIDVLNACRLDSLNGKAKTAQGRARLVDTVSKAKLEVSFFRPFWGDYWIIDLADDYSYAVVGHPGRDYLWILSRTPTMAPEVYAGILERLIEQKYDTSRIIKTLQPLVVQPPTSVHSP